MRLTDNETRHCHAKPLQPQCVGLAASYPMSRQTIAYGRGQAMVCWKSDFQI